MYLAVFFLAFVALAAGAFDSHGYRPHKKEPDASNKETIIHCASRGRFYWANPHNCRGYIQKDQYGLRVFRRDCGEGTIWAQKICGCVVGSCHGPKAYPIPHHKVIHKLFGKHKFHKFDKF